MLKIAIVDDEIWVCRLIQKLIDWDKLECELAFVENEGEGALARIISDRPDIVVTDIRMPGMDGITLLENIIKLDKRPETIILSGYPDFNYAIQVMKLGALNYILKPVEKAELNSALSNVKDIIQKKRLHEQTHNQIKEKLENNIYSLKEFFFSKITSRDILDENFLHKTLDENYLFEIFPNYIIVIAKFLSNETSNQREDLLKRKLGDYFCPDKDDQKLEAFPFLYDNKCLYLINYDDTLKEKIKNIIKDTYCALFNDMQGSKYQVLFGVSRSYNDKLSSQQHYNEALAALARFLPEQKEKVYFYQESMDGEVYDVLPPKQEKSIQLYAEALNKSALIDELEQIYRSLEENLAQYPALVYEVTYKIADLILDTVKAALPQKKDAVKREFILAIENFGRFFGYQKSLHRFFLIIF